MVAVCIVNENRWAELCAPITLISCDPPGWRRATRRRLGSRQLPLCADYMFIASHCPNTSDMPETSPILVEIVGVCSEGVALYDTGGSR